MKIVTKKSCISLLITLIMIFNIMLFGLISKVYATDTQNITKIEINNFNIELTDAMTGNQARNQISTTYTYPNNANYCKGNNNVYIKQNDGYVYNDKLNAGVETYVVIEIYANQYGLNVENPEYDFDSENLGDIEIWINGVKKTQAYVADYNEGWRCVDVYIPVSVSEYTGIKHTVTFNSNGGSLVASEEVADQWYAERPENPTKDDKLFTGWYIDEQLSELFDFNTKITEDTTLYAGWMDKVETKKITKIEINNFNIELTDAMTGNQARNLISTTYTYPNNANYCKGNNNVYIKQNGSYVYNDKLNTEAETYVMIDVYANQYGLNVENPEYDFDSENLGDIEIWVNGVKNTQAYVADYNEEWRSVDVYIPVNVNHALTRVETKAATFTEDGNTAYYKCNECEKIFVDKEWGQVETTMDAVTIPSIKTISLSSKAYTYNGKVHKPTITVKDSKGNTIDSKYYTLTYDSGCINAGTYNVKITFKGIYSGTKTVSFKINAKKISSTTIKVTGIKSKVYTGSTIKQTITVKDGDKVLKEGTDYKVSYKKNKYVGTATVTITGIGNYSGTRTRTFKINPKSVSIKSLSAISKGFTVKWGLRTTQTTGYQIEYATNSSFTSNEKKVTVSSNKTTSKKITKLKAKKKYYVRIRTYKTADGVKYYSSWSSVKTVTTKK